MSTPEKSRWLQVAQRASEFRLLQGSSELAESSQRADAAQATLAASQRQSQQAQTAWRDHLSKPVFHAGDDVQFRHFQAMLSETNQHHDDAAERARDELEIAQLALRMQLAEKNALQAAIQNVADRFRLDQARSGQKESDEVWSVAQHTPGGAP